MLINGHCGGTVSYTNYLPDGADILYKITSQDCMFTSLFLNKKENDFYTEYLYQNLLYTGRHRVDKEEVFKRSINFERSTF